MKLHVVIVEVKGVSIKRLAGDFNYAPVVFFNYDDAKKYVKDNICGQNVSFKIASLAIDSLSKAMTANSNGEFIEEGEPFFAEKI